MNVVVQRTWGVMDAYDVWFIFDDLVARTAQVAYFVPREDGPARLEWKDRDDTAVTEPTLRLSGYEVDALRRSFEEHGPTTQDGLALARDAIKVRDRLLSLVERMTSHDSAHSSQKGA